MAAKLSSEPKGFPLPDSNLISEHTNSLHDLSPLYQNLCIFYKQVSADGYTPFMLSSYGMFLESPLPEKAFAVPVCFMPEKIFPYSRLSGFSADSIQPRYLFVDEKLNSVSRDCNGVLQAGDNCAINRFEPDNISISAQCSQKRLLVLMQNNFNGWSATVNGKSVPVLTGNYSFMVVHLEQGTNAVELRFKPDYIVPAAIFSAVCILLAVIFLLIYKPFLQ